MCLKSYIKAVVAPEEAGNLITGEQESLPCRWTPWDFYFGKLRMVVNGESFFVCLVFKTKHLNGAMNYAYDVYFST